MKIAVVLTCFNRINMTRRCITSIIKSIEKYDKNIDFEFFICDDGSNDGTSDMLKEFGKKVNVTMGNGNLFWAKGMAKAMKKAELSNADFYLMINDDVDFYLEAITTMMESYLRSGEKLTAIVGSTIDKDTGEHSYGGCLWNKKIIGEERKIVYPKENAICNQANWNCFLIPKELYDIVGKIDDYYEHSLADYDYSNRIIMNGYNIYVADKYIGYCSRNKIEGSWRDKTLHPKERLRLLHRPNGMPLKSNWYYCKKYYGICGVIIFLRPYLSIIINTLKLTYLRTKVISKYKYKKDRKYGM